MSLGGGGGDTKATTTTEPPKFQTPYIKDVLGQAQTLNQQPGPYYYPGSTVAPANQNNIASIGMLANQAAPYSANVAQQSGDALSQLYASANPLNNPYFASTAQAMVDPATQALQRQVLPGIDSGAVLAGQVGSSRQGIAQGNAINDYTRNLLNSLSQYGSNAYGQGLDALKSGLALAPQTSQLGAMPAQYTGAAGDMQRQYEQQLIDASQQRYNYYQQLPYDQLNYYAGLVGNPLGSRSSSIGPDTSPSGLQSILGGAATGASLGAAIPGFGAGAGGTLLTALGPAGWAGLAAGGLLGSGILG